MYEFVCNFLYFSGFIVLVMPITFGVTAIYMFLWEIIIALKNAGLIVNPT